MSAPVSISGMSRAVLLMNAGALTADIRHEQYARRVKADIIMSMEVCGGVLEKNICQLLGRYDRLLLLDARMTPTDGCPDLFAMLPQDRVCLTQPAVPADGSSGLGPLAMFSRGQQSLFADFVGASSAALTWQALVSLLYARKLPLCLLRNPLREDGGAIMTSLHSCGRAADAPQPCHWFLLGEPAGEIDILDYYRQTAVPDEQLVRADVCVAADIDSPPPLTLMPLTILRPAANMTGAEIKTPIGDALMLLPIAVELNLPIYLPRNFSGDLIAQLAPPTVRVVRKLTAEMRVINTVPALLGTRKLILWIKNWGQPAVIQRFGAINATQAIASAMGVTLQDPAPQVSRPGAPVPGRVLVIPRGSVPKRAMAPAYLDALVRLLQAQGYTPQIPADDYTDPAAFAQELASAEFVVGVYTGPMHLAAAMGVKTVALPFGDSGTAYRPLQANAAVLPTGCERCWIDPADGRVCGEALPACQRACSPDAVLAAMRRLD